MNANRDPFQEISLATVLQREGGKEGRQPVPVVLTTHPAPFGAMLKAARQLKKLSAVRSSPRVVRIEDGA